MFASATEQTFSIMHMYYSVAFHLISMPGSWTVLYPGSSLESCPSKFGTLPLFRIIFLERPVWQVRIEDAECRDALCLTLCLLVTADDVSSDGAPIFSRLLIAMYFLSRLSCMRGGKRIKITVLSHRRCYSSPALRMHRAIRTHIFLRTIVKTSANSCT